MKKNIKYIDTTAFTGSFGRQPKRTAKLFCLVVILLTSITSCKKLIEIDAPITSINSENVFEKDETAIAAMTGIYTRLSQNRFVTGNAGISFYSGLSADELVLHSTVSNISWISYYKNSLAVDKGGFELWNVAYPFIFKCNSIIEGLSNSNMLTPAVSKQILGEAKFMRAFFYFYLINLFGDVPLVLSTDYKVNAVLPRTPKDLVYKQIILDLKDAEELLSSTYLGANLLSPTSERVRPIKGAASALLARVYLYTGEWEKARTQSSLLLSNLLYNLSSINNAFLKASSGNNETIWELQPVNAGWNTEDARIFVINSALGTSKPVYLRSSIINSFELGDQRRAKWTKDTTIASTLYSYPFKYKVAKQNNPVTEYLVIFRLAELFLISAEAKAQLGDISGSQSDLNAIRTRAGLANTTANDKASLLIAIMQERKVELFTEFGHRWLDLKRTNTIDAIMSIVTPQKANTAWQSFQQFYPIPLSEIQKDPNLIQNSGY